MVERKRYLGFLLCVLSVLCVQISAQEFKTVKPGVEYAEVRRDFSGKAVNINLLRLDLSRVRIDVHHANGKVLGTETTSAIAKRNGAIAAINAGFFRLDGTPFAGDPVGLFMVDGNWLSESTNERIQILINNKTARTVFRKHRTCARSLVPDRRCRKYDSADKRASRSTSPTLSTHTLYCY